MNTLSCTMCCFIAPSRSRLVIHLLKRHEHDSNFSVICVETSCRYSCRSWQAYKQHCRRKHNKSIRCFIDSLEALDRIDVDGSDDEMQVDIPHGDACETDQSYPVAKYLLGLETQQKLSKAGVNVVAHSTKSLIDCVVPQALSQVEKDILPLINDPQLLKSVRDVFSTHVHSTHSDLDLHHLDSAQKRLTVYKNKFNYIEPEKILLGTTHVRDSVNAHRLKRHFAYIVPMAKQLEALLNMPEIWQSFQHGHASHSDILQDVCDGSFAKQHPLIRQGRPVLQIMMSFDDLELQNPLRSSKVHKLSMFYFTLANIPVEHRSQLHLIFLIGISRTRDVKLFGLDNILHDFTSTINDLRKTGLRMTINGLPETIWGDLFFAACDSPAAACLGGFKESSGFAWKPCRMCNCNGRTFKQFFHMSHFEPRSMADYLDRCATVTDPQITKAQKDYWSKVYGINRKSPLCSIHNFSVTDQLVQDPMHVLLEGTTAHVLALFLHRQVIEFELFSLQWLNSRLQSFPYSYLDTSKPVPIERKHLVVDCLVKQKAASMLTLCYMLPLVIGEWFDVEDPHYNHLLCMLKIVALCFGPCVDQTTAGELEQLVYSYCTQYKRLYPLAPVRPKMHFMLHFTKQLLQFGPLRGTSSMRFEAKHGFFKDFRWKNFINLPFSLAQKHQLALAHKMTSVTGGPSPNFVYSGDIVGDGASVHVADLPPNILLPLAAGFNTNVEEVFDTTFVEIHGLKFKPGVALLLHDTLVEGVVFGLISKIYVIGLVKVFLVQNMTTSQYFHQYNAYEIVPDNEVFTVVQFSDLQYRWPLPVYEVRGRMLITNRYSTSSVN